MHAVRSYTDLHYFLCYLCDITFFRATYLDHILLFPPPLLDHPHIATHTISCSLPLPVVQKQKLEQTKRNKTKNTKIKHQIWTSMSMESILAS